MLSLVKNIFGSLLLPPGIQVISLFCGIVCLKNHKFIAIVFLLFTLASLYVISVPWAADKLMAYLETYSAIDLNAENSNLSDVGAIVVLAGGRKNDAQEYKNDTIGGNTLIRLRFAAKLANKFPVPILLSGGKGIYDANISEASIMQDIMQNDFGIKREYFLEEASTTTKENAKFSAVILKDKNIKKFLLVTQAWHMKRAMLAFENVGLQAIPAPTDFHKLPPSIPSWALWLPNAQVFLDSALAIREYLGFLWYQVTFMF